MVRTRVLIARTKNIILLFFLKKKITTLPVHI